MRRRRCGAFTYALASSCFCVSAFGAVPDRAPPPAGTPAEQGAPAPKPAPARPTHSSPKRALPDYDQRGKSPTTAGDIALWLPRILLSPLYLVTEYGLRIPLGAGISAAERAHWPEAFYNFFFFGPDHKAGFLPIAFVDFGFRASVGLYVFGDDVFFSGNSVRLHGSTSGGDWLAGVLTDRIALGKDADVSFEVSGIHRPDHTFFGVGSDSLQGNISRYGETSYVGKASFGVNPTRVLRLESGIGLESAHFYAGRFDEDPSLVERAASGAFPLPPGFEGYTAVTSQLSAALDTREPRPAPGSGVRLEADVRHGSDIRRTPGARWLKYGGTAVGFLDINGHNRVLSLALHAELADPLGDLPVPFTEQVTLGGSAPLRGFFPGRLVDRSAAAATLKYRWPIWVWLDGSLQVATGNVFAERFEDFAFKRFRLSSAIGIESIGSRDSSFELLFGIGSETFEHGAQIDSFRFLIGTNHGF
jgi:hypothetical protein